MGRGRVRSGNEWDEQDAGDYEYEDEYEYEELPVRQVRQRARSPQSPQRRQYPPGYRPQRTSRVRPAQRTSYSRRNPTRSPEPSRHRHSVWPLLLGGCAMGIFLTVAAAATVVFLTLRAAHSGSIPVIGGLGSTAKAQTFKHEDTQQVSLSTLSQMQICDKIGNVSLAVDPNANTTTITTTKIVSAGTKADAEQEFGRIAVAVEQLNSLPQNQTCAQAQQVQSTPTTSSTPTSSANGGSALAIYTTIPDSDGFLHGSNDAVDMNITLSPKAFSNAASFLQLDIEAPLGNVTVDGLSGVLNIKGSSGNVMVTRATLINGSHIGTGQGDVTFNGKLASPNDTTTQASFVIQNEQGKIDVTLPSTTNVILSANTNVGNISSDFGINATKSDNSASYRGPLNSSAPTQSIAVLTLDVSTGDISIHKANE